MGLTAWSSIGRASARRSAAALAEVATHAPAPLDEKQRTEHLGRGLSGQLVVALADHPRVHADFSRWHAAAAGSSSARSLPSPTVEFGVFLQSIETRTGPQVARLSVRQALPWPSEFVAATDAAHARAQSAGAQFEATVLDVARTVEEAHWALWAVRQMHAIHVDHRALVDGLSATVRGRVEIGAANLAHLQQVDLMLASLSDEIARMHEAEHAATASLRAAVGVWSDDTLGTPDDPDGPWLPDAELMWLEAAAATHPHLEEARQAVAQADAQVQQARAARLPGLSVGVDWIMVGPSDAVQVDPAESGKDALAAAMGLTVPLWQKSAADQVLAAESMARAARSTTAAHTLESRAALHRAIADVEATGRRAAVVRGTLLPQAEAAYASLLGTYTTGASTVAQAMLAQQALLTMRIELVEAHAKHAQAWARLRAVCGQDIQTRHLAQVERP